MKHIEVSSSLFLTSARGPYHNKYLLSICSLQMFEQSPEDLKEKSTFNRWRTHHTQMQSLQRAWSQSRNMSKSNCVAPCRPSRMSRFHLSYTSSDSHIRPRIYATLVIFWWCSSFLLRQVFFFSFRFSYISCCQLANFDAFQVAVKQFEGVSQEQYIN